MTCGTVGASADRARLIIKEETTFATAVTGTPKFDLLRITSESLTQNTGTTTSNEITGERRVTDVVRTNLSAGGDTPFELSYQSAAVDTTEGMDFVWEAGFQSAVWTAREAVTATTISFQDVATAANGNGTAEIDDSGSGLASFDLYSIISISGSTSGTNDVLCLVTAVSAGTLEVRPLNSTNDLTTQAAGPSVTIAQANYITDGSTCRSFNIEREYQDLTNVFEQFLGMAVDGLSLTIPTEGTITGSATWLGSKAQSASATLGDGSPNASEATDVMNSIDNVLTFTENNAEFDIISWGFTLANNLRARQQVGTPGAVSIGSGRGEFSGTLQAFFADSTFFNKYLNFTETSFISVLQDTAGNVYVFHFPAIKLTAGQRVAGGINTDIIADMSWSAKKAATEGFVCRMHRMDSVDAPAVV